VSDSIRVLHLEDVLVDSELVAEAMAADGIVCEIHRVATRKDFLAALAAPAFDIIFSDFSLPGFDGGEALQHARALVPDVPFVFISGTLGEEYAVEMLQRGATDYVVKQRLSRLAPTVRRALAEARERARRRHAEEKIREQAALLDEARDAIVVRDLGERVTFWNRGAERLYGWTAADAIGRELPLLLSYRDAPQLLEANREVLEKGEWSGEIPKQRRDGSILVVETRWTLVRDASGSAHAVLVIDTDITEKKALQAQFLRAQRLESIGTLAGGIAHDLNNVLSPILMAADILARKPADERSQRMLATIESSARRGADMVRQILAFARGIEGDRVTLQPRHLLKDVEKIARETFPKTIDLRADVAKDLWNVVGDATQLQQVLLNLCVNARDAMPNGGVLGLTLENVQLDDNYARMHLDAKPGPYVVISVSDTGSGIPPVILDKIFDPFFTTKEVGKGTGLGLSTSLAIARSHGGFLSVYSEVGRGSIFKLHLPATLESETTSQKERGIADAPMGKDELVLVVDDEVSIREITRETLQGFGYRVITAADGPEAVALFTQAQGEVAAVITDMRMPYMDGNATFRALQRIDPGVRVIMTSGLGDAGAVPGAASGGPKAFLPKPYTAEKLLATLRVVLDQP
jgi:two-component system cell cycle sensor histidine kinase/response regulator CckA